MVAWLLLSASSASQQRVPVCTWCRGAESWGPWRLSGWACRRRLRWPDPVSVPDSVASNGYTGSTGAGSLPPQSHSCPAATAAKKKTKKKTQFHNRWAQIDPVGSVIFTWPAIERSSGSYYHIKRHTHTSHITQQPILWGLTPQRPLYSHCGFAHTFIFLIEAVSNYSRRNGWLSEHSNIWRAIYPIGKISETSQC